MAKIYGATSTYGISSSGKKIVSLCDDPFRIDKLTLSVIDTSGNSSIGDCEGGISTCHDNTADTQVNGEILHMTDRNGNVAVTASKPAAGFGTNGNMTIDMAATRNDLAIAFIAEGEYL